LAVNKPFGANRPDGASELPPGLVWGFGFDENGRPEALTPGVAANTVAKWIWLHFDLLDQRCHAWLQDHPDLGAIGRITLLSPGDHQHLRIGGNCLAGILADSVRRLDGALDETGHWRFAMADGVLVSTGRHTLNAVEAVRSAVAAGAPVSTPSNLIEAILEEIAADCERMVSSLAEDFDGVEDRVLADAVHDDRRPLSHLRRRLVRVHRRVGSLLTLVHRLDLQAKEEPATSLHAALGRAVQRLADSDHALREMNERGRLLQEEIGEKLAAEANNYLQAISVITALLLPPTLIVGIFGMNVKGLPLTDSENGFLWVMLLSVVCAAGAYWLLKRAPKLLRRSGLIR
jgi:zinc transporter